MNILQAIEAPNLFSPSFKDRATWTDWRAFLAALFGLPLTPKPFPGRANAARGYIWCHATPSAAHWLKM